MLVALRRAHEGFEAGPSPRGSGSTSFGGGPRLWLTPITTGRSAAARMSKFELHNPRKRLALAGVTRHATVRGAATVKATGVRPERPPRGAAHQASRPKSRPGGTGNP